MIVGFTGRYGAGKTEAAEHLAENGFQFHSLSDSIRDEIQERGLEPTRDVMIRVGDELREEHGPSVLGARTAEKIRSEGGDWAVDSIRNPHEVAALRELDDFVLVGITAPFDVRLERLQERGRDGDPKTAAELREKERSENVEEETSQQLDATLDRADVLIENDDTLQQFYQRIDRVVEGYDAGRSD